MSHKPQTKHQPCLQPKLNSNPISSKHISQYTRSLNKANQFLTQHNQSTIPTKNQNKPQSTQSQSRSNGSEYQLLHQTNKVSEFKANIDIKQLYKPSIQYDRYGFLSCRFKQRINDIDSLNYDIFSEKCFNELIQVYNTFRMKDYSSLIKAIQIFDQFFYDRLVECVEFNDEGFRFNRSIAKYEQFDLHLKTSIVSVTLASKLIDVDCINLENIKYVYQKYRVSNLELCLFEQKVMQHSLGSLLDPDVYEIFMFWNQILIKHCFLEDKQKTDRLQQILKKESVYIQKYIVSLLLHDEFMKNMFDINHQAYMIMALLKSQDQFNEFYDIKDLKRTINIVLRNNYN